jgi:hypothetical protein
MTWHTFWRDKKGNIVIWQAPNLPLWFWVGATIGSKIISDITVKQDFEIIAFLAIVTWSWMEILYGASPFRRALGGFVLVATTIGQLS